MNIISIVINEQISKYKIYHNKIPLKKGFHNENTQIWSSGNTVTYMVDNNISYQEEVDYGESCNSPKTFVPSKTDWEFIGWSLNDTPSPNLPTTGIKMDGYPITLYAVFRQPVTLTYYNNSTTAATASGYKYYNCGKTANPAFTITQAAKSGWSPRGWSADTAGNASVTYKSISNTPLSSSMKLYGLYQQTCTLSYNGNGADSGTVGAQNGTRYYNSSGATVDATFRVQANNFVKANYDFKGWTLGSSSGQSYNHGDILTLTNGSTSGTLYAKWLGKPHYFTPLNSVSWEFSHPNGPGEYAQSTTAYEIKVTAKKTAGNYAYGRLTASVPTMGCTKCRIKYNINTGWNGGGGSIVGISGTVSGEGYSEINCPNDTVSIWIQAQDETAYFTTNASITEIYFYN